MVPQLVTQLDSDAPRVLVIGTRGIVSAALADAITSIGLQVIQIEPAALFAHSNELYAAYKCVWLVDPLTAFSSEYENTKALLSPYGAKTVLIVPITDGLSAGLFENRYQAWKQSTSLQQRVILDLNSEFPSSMFVFAHDLVHTSSFSLAYCSGDIDQGVLLDPQHSFCVQTPHDFSQAVLEYLFRPMDSGSIHFKGTPVETTLLVSKVAELYAAYFRKHVHVRVEQVAVTSVLPFVVTEVEVTGASAFEVVDAFVRSLPVQQAVAPQVVEIITAEVVSIPEPQQEYAPPEPVATQPPPILQPQPESPPPQTPPQTQLVQPEIPQEEQQFIRVPPKPVIAAQKPTKPKELDINQELQAIFKTPRAVEKISRVKDMAHTEIVQTSKSKRKKVLFYGGLGFISIGFAGLFLIGVFMATQFFLKQQLLAVAKVAVETNSIAEEEWNELRKTASFLDLQATAYGSVFDLAVVSDAEHLISVATELSNMSTFLAQARTDVISLFLLLVDRTSGDLPSLAQKMTSEAQTAYENLSLVQAGLSTISFMGDSQEKQQLIEAYEEKINELRKSLVLQRQVTPLLEKLFGGSGKKTYALVLQNNQELRPTGGFIQAVALLNFENGALISHNVYSSYEIDAKLSGTVVPPDDLTRFLGEQQWYFRDSNWNPDFVASSQKMSWFIERALGTQVDGIVAVNLDSLSSLIDALGPVELSQYNEILTGKNLKERMEFHSEVVLVDVSQTKDYGVLILEQVVNKIQNIHEDKVVSFVTSLAEGLDQNQILVYAKDQIVQETIASIKWSGALVKPDCPSQFASESCIVDVIAQVASNVGVNKANYYLEETVDHVVTITPSAAEHTRTLRIENTAQSNSWPKGDYKAYYRFYLSPSAKVSTVEINGQPLPVSQRIERVEQGRSLVGFLVTVPVKGQSEVVVRYSVPLPEKESFAYAFFDQVQPGTSITESFTLVPAAGLRPALIAPQAEVTPRGIVFAAKKQKSHGFYGVEFK